MDFGAVVSPLRCHANFKYLSIFVYVFFLEGGLVERESIAFIRYSKGVDSQTTKNHCH